jgi:hypothetical protein
MTILKWIFFVQGFLNASVRLTEPYFLKIVYLKFKEICKKEDRVDQLRITLSQVSGRSLDQEVVHEGGT